MSKIKKDLAEDLLNTIQHYILENETEIIKPTRKANIEKEIFPAIIRTTLIFTEWLADYIKGTDKDFDKFKYMMDAVDQIYKRSKEAIESAPKKPEKSIILN